MKNVLLRGPFLTNSGYGVHARQITRWAISKKDWNVKVQTLPWGITPWLIDRHLEDGLVGQIMDRTGIQSDFIFDLSIQVQLPNEWDDRFARKNIGITAAVETDRCNPAWIDKCNKMSVVVVPSKHAKLSLENTSAGRLKTPVIVVPESFHDEINQDIPALNIDFSTKFNFLVFGQLTGNNPENDRKNLFYTLKWMFEEFKDDEDVGIILKTNSGRTTKIDRHITEKVVKQLVKEARKTAFPRLHFVHGKMTNTEIAGLMRHPSVKALVSLTRGEGYGLPILEAAAASLPVIATGWSGYTDFLREGDYISVDYTLGPIHKSRVDGGIFMDGSRWAHPDEKDAKKKLRKFYQKSTMPHHRAQEVAKRIRHDLSFDAISALYDVALHELIQ